MNWDAIGAVGEIMGAVAVFLSLVYLGMQIRSNTTSMNTASRQAIANEFRDWIRLTNEDNRVFATGLVRYPAMDFDTRATFCIQMHDLLLFYQSAHALFESGTLEEDTHNRYLTWVAAVMLTPGAGEFWREWMPSYNESMTSAVRERMLAGDLPEVTDFPQYNLDLGSGS